MADYRIKGVNRERLHQSLSAYLDGLKRTSDAFMVYQAAYAYQALEYISYNEQLWQTPLQRIGNQTQNEARTMKGADSVNFDEFLVRLNDIQQELDGVIPSHSTSSTNRGVKSMNECGQDFLDCLNESLCFESKQAWYPALRMADVLFREGRFADFRRLVCEAPCRRDPTFQWGVCQRLGDLAVNSKWDAKIRQSAVALLGEIYRNDTVWGRQAIIKQWIIDILKQLTSTLDVKQTARAVLRRLRTDGDSTKQAMYQACLKAEPSSYPLRVALPPPATQSLLDRVQDTPDVETRLRRLRKQCLKERRDAIYVPLQAKANSQASIYDGFLLMDKVKEFLSSDRDVFLLLGDSGVGKSTFNRALKSELWNTYKKIDGEIPLYIDLTTIDKPKYDLIPKQLQREGFTETQITEMKSHRKFVLICDEYEDSQQMRNLYTTNRLNQRGEWNAKMVISCRSEYLGSDYQLHQKIFQHAVIMPFSVDQVQNYINQYVPTHQTLWESDNYIMALDRIPGLKSIVKNPLLLSLSMEVLPQMTRPGRHILMSRHSKVRFYDHLVEHWFESDQVQLEKQELTHQARAAFEKLTADEFTLKGVNYMKELAVAIYKNQHGTPVVEFSRSRDEGTWKDDFFRQDDHKQLLRNVCPLKRNGNQYQFVHPSLLEYSLALAVFDPSRMRKITAQNSMLVRRGSAGSCMSFEIQDTAEGEVTSVV
ncbi:Transducin (beta)-like 1 X-linked receptor 1 [Modicella reniformis]|uniref:Transducin (Beta)-like 1 X-linked receptor 1 n=1 Tax=Modicella reniformis TaxID=1440133 RepID=A0A9P6ITD6_9FUNG|nr:Transducin (beta)-like 1 X-linked receptor 1 [Modicella reniformis]